MGDDDGDVRHLDIVRVGAQGDGVAETDGGRLFVPFTLAGERVTARVKGTGGTLVSIVTASASRIAPVCRHFGVCGGCALQHMRADDYLSWKREQVSAAFAARGITADIAPVRFVDGKRRRAVLSAERRGSGVAFGYHQAGSHDLVDLAECPVLDARIVAAFPALKALVSPLLARHNATRVTVTMTNGGLDVALADVGAKLTPALRARIAEAATEGRFARVSINGDPTFAALSPTLTMGLAEVIPAPGAFLQAVAEAEALMSDEIIAAAGRAKSIADLFSGLGAFTFRLAKTAKVMAVDSEASAISALQTAARNAQGLRPITALVRDLYRDPLSPLELKDFECVVFDPPRAGAEAQAERLSRSKVKTVIAVSCNPATLARDARTLIDGGYILERVQPFDQFHFSPHIEAIAIFRR
ncbi:MAG: class I SAM-dependent RNA methyltransferase [Hyphomicrobium sp.]